MKPKSKELAPASDEATPRVGYKSPPRRTRFKKGQSGNPAGRPKGSRPFISLLEKALNEQVTVNEGGRRTAITKREALAKQIANKGAAGDLKVAMLLLNLRKEMERNGVPSSDSTRSEPSARELVERKIQEIADRLAANAVLQGTDGAEAPSNLTPTHRNDRRKQARDDQ